MQKKTNIFTIGSHDIKAINKTFSLCVWNVHKCLSKELIIDIERLFHKFDIILMQEAVFSEKWNQIWKNILHFEWGFFRSFSLGKNAETGVLTGSKFRQKILDIIPTVDTEPLLRTPKASGLSLIDIEGTHQKLLVVNTHAMNFNFGKPFQRQIETVYEAIKNHE
jgi:endonuclease/exonuclease/phosphatase (EEP) superfamily protein YafD